MNDNNREYISVGANVLPQQNQRANKKKKSLLSKFIKATAVIFVLFIISVFMGATEELGVEEEELLQYSTEQYYEVFGSSSASEDNILFVFLIDEGDYSNSSSIGIVGANVNDYIHIMFEEYGDYYDLFDDFLDYIQIEYFSIDYAGIIDSMTANIMAHGFYSSFDAPSDRSNLVTSGVINKTELDLKDGYIDAALKRFTEETEIPCVLVVEYEKNVYSDFESVYSDIFMALLLLLVIMIPVTLCVAFIGFVSKSSGGNPTGGNRPPKPYTTGGGFAEKCGKDGCDGRVRRDERPPWEYD